MDDSEDSKGDDACPPLTAGHGREPNAAGASTTSSSTTTTRKDEVLDHMNLYIDRYARYSASYSYCTIGRATFCRMLPSVNC